MRVQWPLWLKQTSKASLTSDAAAGIIMAVLLIPQNLAYAMLAGLPPQIGLYATLLPVIAYSLFGTSMTLAVGPVAVASLMTAASLQGLAVIGTPEYIELAVGLACISGLMLISFGLLRLGFLAHFLSHPVLSGFTTGSAILIVVGQINPLLGIKATGSNVFQTVQHQLMALPDANLHTTGIGLVSLFVLWLAKKYLHKGLMRVGLSTTTAELVAKLAPLLVLVVATVVVSTANWATSHAVAVVGSVPAGLPSFVNPLESWSRFPDLWLNALLIALVGFVQSVSVAQAMALRRQEKIDPDRELIGLGMANMASAMSGSYPVAGGLARTAVSFSAGAKTPIAGLVSTGVIAIIVASFTGLFYHLPLAVLASIILMAISSLIDIKTLRRAWLYDKADAWALIATFVGVLALGVQEGIVLGVALSLVVLVWRSSRPHMAIVGRVPGTEHFRNIERHHVLTLKGMVALRVDESLFFANIGALEEKVMHLIDSDASVKIVVLICSAVNRVDSTALGVLTELELSMAKRGIALWLTEVKGPVMDRLSPTPLGKQLQGRVYLSTYEAFIAARQSLGLPSES